MYPVSSKEISPCHVANFSEFPPEVLTSLFQFVVCSCKDVTTLTLTCKKWHLMMVTDSNLLKILFKNIGFPFSVHESVTSGLDFIKCAQSAFRDATNSSLPERARACTFTESLGSSDWLQNCNKIQFLDNRYIIGYDDHQINVADLKLTERHQLIPVTSKILSLCAVEKEVYYVLDTGAIFSFSLDFFEKRVLQIPESMLFGTFASDADPTKRQSLENCWIYASSQWLVCVSPHALEKWDRITKELMGKEVFDFSMRNFQMNWENLYWAEGSEGVWSLVCWNLNTDRIQKYELASGIEALHTIHVSGKRCSFIVQTELPQDQMASDSSEDSDVRPKLSVVNFDLYTNQKTTYDISTIGFDENPVLLLSSGLTLFGRGVQDPDNFFNIHAAPRPQILELRDLEGEIVLHLPNYEYIHGAEKIWSITFFQNMLLYVTDRNITRITFPERNKRSGEADLEGDAKRQKITGSFNGGFP